MSGDPDSSPFDGDADSCFCWIYRQISQRAVVLLHQIYSGMASAQPATYLVQVMEHDKDKLRIAALKVVTEMTSLATDADYLNTVIRR